MKSPGFSKFRALMDLWDEHLLREDMDQRVDAMLNSPKLSFLFVKDGNVYGAGEDSRLTFAKLKSRKTEDEIDGWKDEADFMGVKLVSVIRDDHPSHAVFGKKDLKDIRVIDQKEAKQKLLRSLRQNDLG